MEGNIGSVAVACFVSGVDGDVLAEPFLDRNDNTPRLIAGGARAVIGQIHINVYKEDDKYTSEFQYYVMFDNETWISTLGGVSVEEVDRKALFYFKENKIEEFRPTDNYFRFEDKGYIIHSVIINGDLMVKVVKDA